MAEAQTASATPSVGGLHVRGYVEAEDKERIRNRFRRVEGQVRDVQRMVAEEAYCVDILTQISGADSALEKVGAFLLKDQSSTASGRPSRTRRRQTRRSGN